MLSIIRKNCSDIWLDIAKTRAAMLYSGNYILNVNSYAALQYYLLFAIGVQTQNKYL